MSDARYLTPKLFHYKTSKPYNDETPQCNTSNRQLHTLLSDLIGCCRAATISCRLIARGGYVDQHMISLDIALVDHKFGDAAE
jgi:hypothetical protein